MPIEINSTWQSYENNESRDDNNKELRRKIFSVFR